MLGKSLDTGLSYKGEWANTRSSHDAITRIIRHLNLCTSKTLVDYMNTNAVSQHVAKIRY